MKKIIDRGWYYADGFSPEMTLPGYDTAGMQKVDLPHCNREIPVNYFDVKSYQFVSCYRCELTRPKFRRVFLNFEGVMARAELYVNGVKASESWSGYTDFETEITPYLTEENNVVALKVDSREDASIPPFGNVLDYLTYGGVYRDVTLQTTDEVRIRSVFAHPKDAEGDPRDIEVEAALDGAPVCGTLLCEVLSGGKAVASQSAPAQGAVTFSFSGLPVKLWELDAPALYTVRVTLTGASRDAYELQYGFRTARFTKNGFFLNGRKVKLVGLDRHQSYPYVGYAMPRGAQEEDADVLKYELGANVVRTSHYPQSHWFLDRCDEIGLLVFTEIPGWQHIGEGVWRHRAVDNVRRMVERDRNHPSVVLWGVRINESRDDDELYEKTNAVAHSLDPYRQTGGVRCITGSNLLEDVYTFNDFVLDGGPVATRPQREVTGLSYDVPYLITEFNGHMYPTKMIDPEQRLVEHALRHARVIDSALGDATCCGAIGWCAFDYNTHHEFGSGDKVCYHGVMDMFREPKFAAFFYKSQLPPEKCAVLEPASIWALGERDGGGVLPFTVFTNCDAVGFTAGEEEEKLFYPDRKTYPHLAHPPVTIEAGGAWGGDWQNAYLVGYLGGKPVARRTLLADPLPDRLTLVPSRTELAENDVARLAVSAVDAAGNRLKYFREPVTISVMGAKLVGPDTVFLAGGVYAFYVRTDRAGEISVAVSSHRLGTAAAALVCRADKAR